MVNKSLFKHASALALLCVWTNCSMQADEQVLLEVKVQTKTIKKYAASALAGIAGHGALVLARYVFRGDDQWYSLGRYEALSALCAKLVAIKGCNFAFRNYFDIETDEAISWITGAGIFTVKEIVSYTK